MLFYYFFVFKQRTADDMRISDWSSDVCSSDLGFGAPTKAGKSSSHGSPLGPEEIAGAREKLGWHHPPFVVPDEILEAWRAVGRRSANRHGDWAGRLADRKSGV